RAVLDPRVEQRLDDLVAALEHVADDDATEVLRELSRVVALVQADAERPELRAQRRVDALGRARQLMAGCRRERRDAAHERAADAENVYAHRGLADQQVDLNSVVTTTQGATADETRAYTVRSCISSRSGGVAGTGPQRSATSADDRPITMNW